MPKLTPEQCQIRDIIKGEFFETLYKVMEAKALNNAIYNAAEEDLSKTEKLENLYLLIRVQEQVLNTVIEDMDLVDNHISGIIYHRGSETAPTVDKTATDRRESSQQ